MNEKQKRTLRRMETSSPNWSKYGVFESKDFESKEFPYINFDEDCEDDLNFNENKKKKSKEIKINKKECDTVKKLTDYFNESFSNEDEEEEEEIYDFTYNDNSNDNLHPIKRICKFHPTTYKNFKPKETMKIVCPDNTNNESFVSFDPEKAKQKKAKENELKKQTLEYLEGFDASQTVRNELMNNDKKFYWLMEKFSHETTPMNDVALKIATELMSPKIKRKKLFVDRDARGKNCRYKHIDADDSWQIEIGEGGWFQKGNYRIDNKKSASNGQPKITQKNIDGKNFTFVLK